MNAVETLLTIFFGNDVQPGFITEKILEDFESAAYSRLYMVQNKKEFFIMTDQLEEILKILRQYFLHHHLCHMLPLAFVDEVMAMQNDLYHLLIFFL